jgi:hypothetical protein
MAQYTVIQDIEAEDKFVGPLTLKQFIFAGGATVLLYLSFILITKHLWPLTLVLVPPALVALFLAWPWGRDQPTEIWLLAKLRFAFKPRRRIWDQGGLQELVTITVPKKVEEHLTNGLDETQVRSRLQTLAQTIDTRGWAIKGVSSNLNASDDRLSGMSALPVNPALVPDDNSADDILDARNNPLAQQMNRLVEASDKNHRQVLMDQIQEARNNPQPTPPSPVSAPPNYFNQQFPGDASAPLPPLPKLPPHQTTKDAYGQTPVLQPDTMPMAKPPVAPINPAPKPAILELAHNDDLSVATIARQANKANHLGDDEVVISLR